MDYRINVYILSYKKSKASQKIIIIYHISLNSISIMFSAIKVEKYLLKIMRMI